MEAGARAVGGKAGERVWRGGGAQGHAGSGLSTAEWGAVAKTGGHQRPLKQCQCSTGKCVRSGGLEKYYVKQFRVSRP